MAWPAIAVLAEHSDGRADLARRAVAALEAVALYEGGLHRMKPAGLAEAFDGGDLLAFVHDGEGQAAHDARAAHQNRAGAALALVTPLLCAEEAKVLAQ